MKLKYKETLGDGIVEYEFEGDVNEVVRAFETLVSGVTQVAVSSGMDKNIDNLVMDMLLDAKRPGGILA